MGLIDFKVYYQTECILQNKRKVSLCDISTNIPLEVRDISMEDVNLVAFEVFIHNEQTGRHVFPNDYRNNQNMDLKNIIKPYYEYNGELYTIYEGYHFNDNNMKSLNEKIVNNFNEDILKKTCSDLHDVPHNIETIQGLLAEDFSTLKINFGRSNGNIIIQSDEIKFSKGNNFDFIKRQAEKYMDNFLFIDGKLFSKTYGPVLKIYQHQKNEIKVKYEQRVISNFSPYDLYSNNGIGGFCCYSMLNFIDKNLLCNDTKSKQNTINYNAKKLFDNQVVIINQSLLYETTRQYFGLFIFHAFLNAGERSMKNSKSHTIRNSSELKIDTWLKSIQNKYDFGTNIYNAMKDCIDSHYDYDKVIYFIEIFKMHLNDFNKTDNDIQSLRKYVSDDLPKIRKNTNRLVLSDNNIVKTMLNYLNIYNNGIYNMFDNKDCFNIPNVIGCENNFILKKDLSDILKVHDLKT